MSGMFTRWKKQRDAAKAADGLTTFGRWKRQRAAELLETPEKPVDTTGALVHAATTAADIAQQQQTPQPAYGSFSGSEEDQSGDADFLARQKWRVIEHDPSHNPLGAGPVQRVTIRAPKDTVIAGVGPVMAGETFTIDEATSHPEEVKRWGRYVRHLRYAKQFHEQQVEAAKLRREDQARRQEAIAKRQQKDAGSWGDARLFRLARDFGIGALGTAKGAGEVVGAAVDFVSPVPRKLGLTANPFPATQGPNSLRRGAELQQDIDLRDQHHMLQQEQRKWYDPRRGVSAAMMYGLKERSLFEMLEPWNAIRGQATGRAKTGNPYVDMGPEVATLAAAIPGLALAGVSGAANAIGSVSKGARGIKVAERLAELARKGSNTDFVRAANLLAEAGLLPASIATGAAEDVAKAVAKQLRNGGLRARAARTAGAVSEAMPRTKALLAHSDPGVRIQGRLQDPRLEGSVPKAVAEDMLQVGVPAKEVDDLLADIMSGEKVRVQRASQRMREHVQVRSEAPPRGPAGTPGQKRLDEARTYGRTPADDLADGDQAYQRYLREQPVEQVDPRAGEVREQQWRKQLGQAPEQSQGRSDPEAWEQMLRERELSGAGRFADDVERITRGMDADRPFVEDLRDLSDEAMTAVAQKARRQQPSSRVREVMQRGAAPDSPIEGTIRNEPPVDPRDAEAARAKFDEVARADAEQRRQWLQKGEEAHQRWKAAKKEGVREASEIGRREKRLVDAVEASPMREDRDLVPGIDTDEILQKMRKSPVWRELDDDIKAEIVRRRSGSSPVAQQPEVSPRLEQDVQYRRFAPSQAFSTADTAADLSEVGAETPQDIVAGAGRIQGKGAASMPKNPRGRVLGFYSKKAQMSQIDDATDVGTAYHEFAHEIVHKGGVKLDELPPKLREDLAKWEGSHDGTVEEGFAEAVGRWVAGGVVPRRAKAWIDKFAKKPEGKRIREAKAKFTAYWNSSPLERMRLHTAKPGERPEAAKGDPIVTAWTRFADRRFGMKKLLDDMEFRTPAHARSLDPVAIFDATNKTAGERAYQLIATGNYYGPSGFRDLKGLTQINKELGEAIAGGSVEDVMFYMLAKRSAQKGAEGIATPYQTSYGKRYTPAEMIEFAEKKYGKALDTAVKDLQALNSAALERAVEVGLVSRESFDRMREADPFYMTLLRALPQGTHGASKMGFPSVLRPLTGSERHKVMHPVEGMLVGAELITKAADRAYVVQRFVDLMQSSDGYGRFVVPFTETTANVQTSVKRYRQALKAAGVELKDLGQVETMVADIAAMSGGRDDIVHLYRDGKKHMVRLPHEVMEMFRTVPPQALPAVARVGAMSRTVTGLFKKSVVDWNPFFVAKNLVRDFMTTMSKQGPVDGAKLYASGSKLIGKEIAKKVPWYRDGEVVWDKYSEDLLKAYKATGMRSSGWYDTPDRARALWQELNQDKGLRAKLRIIDSAKEVMALTEHVARIGAFEKQLKAAGWSGRGMPTESQMIAATNAAAEITTDFRRSGIYTEWANQHVPFLNAAVQSSVNFVEHMKKDPKAAFAKGAATITALSVLEWAQNHDKTWYKELSDAERNAFWFAETPMGIFRIPKPFEQGALFGSVPSAALQAAFDSDEEVAGLLTEAVKSMTPPLDASSMTPAIVRPAVEWWGNRSLWTDRPVTSPWKKGKVAPEHLASPSTPETYKRIGRMLRFLDTDLASPDALAHFTRGHMKVADDAIRAVESGGVDTGFKHRFTVGQSEAELFRWGAATRVKIDRGGSKRLKALLKQYQQQMRKDIMPLREQLKEAKAAGDEKRFKELHGELQRKSRILLQALKNLEKR